MGVEFWKATGIRALRTFCQVIVALVGTGAIGITEVDWLSAASVAATSAVMSVITSIATGLPEVPTTESKE